MASAPPTAPSTIVLGSFSGIKNTVSEERLKTDELVAAVNVDIDDVGQLRRRRGRTRIDSSNHHSLVTIAGRTLVVRDGMLGTLTPGFAFDPIYFVGPERLAYTRVGEVIYFASSVTSGKIVDGAVLPWGEEVSPGQWVSPVIRPTAALGAIRGKLLGSPPTATELETYKGRIYLASGKLIWATELYLYDLVDKTRNFIQIEDEITMLAAMDDGMYVGTTRELLFLQGVLSTGMTRRIVINAPVVSGSSVWAPYSKVLPQARSGPVPEGFGPIFMTGAGVCVGLDGGQVYNLTQDHVVFPKAVRAAALYREDQGAISYVAVTDSAGGPSANARIGDYVDADIVRASARPRVRVHTLFGSMTSRGLLSGTLSGATVDLLGDFFGLGVFSGTLDIANQLQGVVSQTSDLSASMIAAAQLESSVGGTSLFASSFPQAGASLVSNIGGQSALNGSASTLASLTGLLAAQSAFGGIIATSAALVGGVDGQSTLNGSASTLASLVGNVGGQSVLLATFTAGTALAGDIAGQGAATGTLRVSVALSGAIIGQGAATGTLRVSVALSGAIIGQGAATGTLRVSVALSSSAVGAGLVAGSITNTGSAYDSDATAYFAAMTVQPDSTRKGLLNTFIAGLKTDGVWNNLDWLVLHAAHDSQAGILNARVPSKLFSSVNSPAFTTDRGYKGDGTSAELDAAESLTVSGALYAQNNCVVGVWCNQQGASVGQKPHIGQASSGARTLIYGRDDATAESVRLNSGTARTVAVLTMSRIGHRTLVRTSSTSFDRYTDGNFLAATTDTSSTPNSGSVRVFRDNNTRGDDRIAATYWGASLTATQITAMHVRLNTYLTAIGAN